MIKDVRNEKNDKIKDLNVSESKWINLATHFNMNNSSENSSRNDKTQREIYSTA